MAISVVITTFNSSHYLREVLSSVKEFDEVLVCDMHSTDNTLDIAREFGCNIVEYPEKRPPFVEAARNFAIHSARSKWVLLLDDDELVPAPLADYLKKFSEEQGEFTGLYIPRKKFLLNIWERTSYPDYQLRFFLRDATTWPAEIHSEPEILGRVTKIPAIQEDKAILHKSHTITEIVEKLNRYTTAELQEYETLNITFMKLFGRPLKTFCSSYFGKGRFRYGVAGLISSCNDAIHRYVRLAKLYEQQVNGTRDAGQGRKP